MSDTVPSYVLEGVASLIEIAGQDPTAIATAVELNPAALYQSDVLISEVKINDLFEEAARVCDDRFFGLKAGQLKGLDMIGPLWLLVQQASTVGEVLTLLSENMALHAKGFSIFIYDDGEAGISVAIETSTLKLEHFQKAPKNSGVIQVVEHIMAVINKELLGSLGRSWFPKYIQFRHSAPEDIIPLKKVFGEHLYFNQDINAIHLTREDAQTPNYRNPDNTISSDAKKLVTRELESSVGLGKSFVWRVERIIRTLINNQGVTANDVALALNIPLRTLQYRLKKKSTSYQALYDNAREELAKHYLCQSELSVSAVAERLRFTDSAAFSNFFKRRVGCSPSEYVQRMCSG